MWRPILFGEEDFQGGNIVLADLVEADVFVPEGGILGDEGGEHVDAGLGAEIDDNDAIFAEPVRAALKIDGFTDEDGADAELADKTAAIPAGSEGGDHSGVAVAFLATGAAEGIRFTVSGRIAVLNPAIVTFAEQVAGGVEESGADGNAAFGETDTRFREGNIQHGLIFFMRHQNTASQEVNYRGF